MSSKHYDASEIDALRDEARCLGSRLQEVIDEIAARAKIAVEEMDSDDDAAGALAAIEALRNDNRSATG